MQRINPKNIRSNGTYTDIENNCIINLNDEQMKKLYELYPDELDMIYKNYKRMQAGVPNYKLSRQKKGVSIKKFVNKVVKPVIIGSFVVVLGTLVVDSLIVPDDKPIYIESVAIDSSSYVNSYLDSYEQVPETVISPEMEYQMEMSQLVKKYCDIYEIDFDIAYNKLCELTDNFTSEDFMNRGHIPGVTCNKQEVYTENKELAILVAIRHFKQIPGDFGLKKDELYTGVHYESEESYEMIIAKYAELFGISEYRDLAYGIWFSETGGNSRLLVEDNNFGGLKDGDGMASYANREMGGIEFIVTISKFVDMGKTTPVELQGNYAPSFENDGEQWVANVEWNMMKADSVYENIDEQLVMRGK